MADPATLIAAEQVVSTTLETGAVAAYGLAQKTQPLSATFNSISSPAFLPRSHHTLTIINGKGYIWGGYDSGGGLAGSDMHIVQLPAKSKSKGSVEGAAEYKVVPALGGSITKLADGKEEEGSDGEVPTARAGHTAVGSGQQIYLFGGKGEDGNVIEEKGRLWIFDTETLHWSFIDPASGTPYPVGRFQHGCVSSEHPLPSNSPDTPASTYKESIQNTLAKVPSLLGKSMTPKEPHGTIILCSGLSSSSSNEALKDAWSFNVLTSTWTELPSLPSSITFSSAPSIALTHNRLYTITSSSDVGSEMLYLPLPKTVFYDSKASGAEADPNANLQPMFGGQEKSEAEKKGDWTTLPFPSNPLAPGPRPRKGAGLVPVTTGNGREYLLYFLGERLASSSSPSKETSEGPASEEPLYWSDVWSYQTPAQAATASGIKDATRSSLGIATGEGTWAEVTIVADVEEVVESGQDEAPEKKEAGKMETGQGGGKSHPGPRGWFGAAGIDGNGVVLWGGKNAKGEVEGEGWIVRIK
ncbi:hypothetical protein G7Y79_00046g082310 [Physcia stellaris]|nr:hypothetical protein G7Y79_00046g082310 [Physcia stellaris]